MDKLAPFTDQLYGFKFSSNSHCILFHAVVSDLLAHLKKNHFRIIFYRRPPVTMVPSGFWDDRRFPLRGHLYLGTRGGRQQQFLLFPGSSRLYYRIRSHRRSLIATLLSTQPYLHLFLSGDQVWLLVL